MRSLLEDLLVAIADVSRAASGKETETVGFESSSKFGVFCLYSLSRDRPFEVLKQQDPWKQSLD